MGQMLEDPITMLLEVGLGWVGLVLFVALLLASEIGYQLGVRRAHGMGTDDRTLSAVSTLSGAMLGLVAFLLALTLNFAENRYETRRLEVVHEANAIGTAWLRARLVGGTEGDAIAGMISDYTRVRLEYSTTEGQERAADLSQRTSNLQTEIWQMLAPAARSNPTPVMATLVVSLNDMFDASLVQHFAFVSRVPSSVSWMLLFGSMLAMGAMGYQFGQAGRRQVVLTGLLLLMWTGALVLTIDFNEPRIGLLRVDTQPLIWTLQGFGQPVN